MKFLKGTLLLMLLSIATLAWALQTTPSPPIPPNETGENSVSQQEIFNVSRLKPSFATGTTAGSGTAQTITINSTAGVITSNVAWTIVSGAGASGTLTVTNNHIQSVNDVMMVMIDDTGATAASLLEVSAVQISAAGTAVIKVVNNFTTANTVAPKFRFFIVSSGNPN